MITIVNYGLGNVKAFENIYRRLGMPVSVASSTAGLTEATKLILPGVGAFDWAMKKLGDSGMQEKLDQLVSGERIPVLGVCVGMQMLANSSEEGRLDGLGWIDAEVRKIESESEELNLPHMGWNDLKVCRDTPLLSRLPEDPEFYFLHSYHFLPQAQEDIVATSLYGTDIVAVVQSGNVFGTQFHPEKSHAWGVQILKNFGEL